MSVIGRTYVVWLCAGCEDCEPSDGSPRSPYPCTDSPSMDGAEVVLASSYRGAVEAFAQERQAVLDCVNLYGDETLHKALDAIGWPADYIGGSSR